MRASSSPSESSPTGPVPGVARGADFSIPRTSANVRAAVTLALGGALLSLAIAVNVARTNSLASPLGSGIGSPPIQAAPRQDGEPAMVPAVASPGERDLAAGFAVALDRFALALPVDEHARQDAR